MIKNSKYNIIFSIIFVLFLVSQFDKCVSSSHPLIDLAFGGRCTTIAVSRGASTEGPMVTHTADCSDCDFRVNKVPAMDHPEGSVRTLYEYRGPYPATVTKERGEKGTWHPDNLQGSESQLDAWGSHSVITGTIPQVAHTYAIIEGGYGMINEHQVIIGESTCAAKMWASPPSNGGKAIIEARELSRVALERTKSAREAVELMGALAEKYGFYSADWLSGGDMSLGEGGEALTVGDTKEAWVFHVLPDDTGTSAVWAAQKVPEGHVAVVANQFIIKHIDPTLLGTEQLYSSNIFEVAKRKGFWKEEDGLLHFTTTYAPARAHAPYSNRRVWRVFNLVAPSYYLPGDIDPLAVGYPFSVPVDDAVGPRDLMRIQRDHYEGTPYDMTKGLAAGPFGDPTRFDPGPNGGMTMGTVLNGSFERAIAMFRTSTTIVAQARHNLPDAVGARLWLATYNPASSSFLPLYPAGSGPLPSEYTTGSLFKYDPRSAFWNFLAVGNYAARFFNVAMPEVKIVQDALEHGSFVATEAAEKDAVRMLDNGDKKGAAHVLGEVSIDQATVIVSAWVSLLPKLITVFHDGYHAQTLDGPKITMTKLFYPEWWLEAVGYFNQKPNQIPGMIWFNSNPADADADADGHSFASHSHRDDESNIHRHHSKPVPLIVEPGPVIPAPDLVPTDHKTKVEDAQPVHGAAGGHLVWSAFMVALGAIIGGWWVRRAMCTERQETYSQI